MLNFKTFLIGVSIFLCLTIKCLAEPAAVTHIKDLFQKNENGNMLWSLVDAAKDGEFRNANDEKCYNLLKMLKTAVMDQEIWAAKIFDSWGKWQSGIYYGNTASLGQFDECLEQKFPSLPHETESESQTGKYCLTNFLLDDSTESNYTKLFKTAPSFGGAQQTAYRFGICIPQQCTVSFMNSIIKKEIENLNIKLNDLPLNDYSCSTDSKPAFKTADYIAIIIFSFIAILMLVSTIYEIVMNYLNEIPRPIYLCFSLKTNFLKLMAIQTERAGNILECLSGIRVISIIWVVFCHTYMINSYVPIINLYVFPKWLKNYYSMFVVQGTLSVDSFLLIGGLLISWNVFKELDKNGKINIFMMYIHRYIRLTPALAAAVLFCVSLIQYVGSGPLWNAFMVPAVAPCQYFWWSAFTYLQNYINPYAICVGHSWYISVDMQLYILSPWILIGLWKYRSKILWIIPVLILLSISSTFTLYMIYDFSTKMYISDDKHQRANELTYTATHARIGPWCVGIILAYILHTKKSQRIRIPKAIVLFGWVASIILYFTIIFGAYNIQQIDAEPTTLQMALFESLCRTSWSIALAWTIFACSQGYGGFINKFLSSPLWQPLVRIQYAIYINHLIYLTVAAGWTRTPINWDNFTIISKFWGNFGMIVCISVLTTLAFESPIISLEKIVFGRNSKRPSSQLPITAESIENFDQVNKNNSTDNLTDRKI